MLAMQTNCCHLFIYFFFGAVLIYSYAVDVIIFSLLKRLYDSNTSYNILIINVILIMFNIFDAFDNHFVVCYDR